MAVPKRVSKFLGLKNLDVFKEDTTFDSTYFRVLECPSILTQGKSSFLIGGSEKLKTGVEIKIEICHNLTNETIYNVPVYAHLEGDLRRVSIEVYEDITPGPYTLYIVGEIDPTVENIPSQWQGAYNVRWSKQITVNGMGVNTQPVYFYKQPSIRVSETSTGYVEVPSSSATPIYLTGSGEPRQGLPPISPVENVTDGGFGESTYPELDFSNKAKLSIIEENKPLVKLSGKQGLIGSKGQQVKTMSPVLDDYVITLSGNSTINSLYVGHDIIVNNPQVDTSKFTLQSHHSVPSAYSSSVMKVLNETSFVPKDVFYVYDNRTSPATLEPAPLANTYPISASYLSLDTQSTSSINVVSYADMTISDLRTFSGDVHKIKVYAKSEGSLGDFEKIYDAALESSQVLYDKTEATSQVNMGYFLDNTRLQNYWEKYQGEDGGTVGTLTYDATYINDSMKISGSNLRNGDTLRVQNKTAVDFIKGTLYSFKAKVYGIKTLKYSENSLIPTDQASLKVMTYGDAFNKTENTSTHWGDERLSIPDMPSGITEYDFGIVEGNFLADNTGTGNIQFQADSGEWYVSDIQVKSATDTAFNPDFVKIKTPVPPLSQRPDRIRFLVEFYDVNNNIADSVIFSEPFTFQGPNINISGTDNILSGSMFIGNALAAGIEMAGVSSAFVRSMGYQGFSSGSGGGNNAGDGTNSGFLMWSGSVLADSGDDYKGVGLELVGHSGSYFKFRTNPSELDIRTDKFFIGQETIQFMSGSDGNIEISSSLFHLDPVNDLLVIGADAVINADLSVNNIFSPAGTNIHTAKAAITSEGYAKFVSASIGAFKLNDDSLFSGPNENPNFFISGSATGTDYFISASNFQVRASGEVSASSLKLSGGDVGGLSVTTEGVSVGDILKLKATGDITASAVSMSGTITADAGTIAGWKIIGNKLSGSNATLDAGGAALYMSSKGPDTDSSATFDIQRDEYYIDFTPADQGNTTNYFVKFGPNFAVDSDGVLIASGAVFEGQITASTGLIGGASIESASLAYSPFWRISSSADTSDPTSFISSSRFKVSAGGNITGSQVLFTGGDIAGWNINGNSLHGGSGGTIRLNASAQKITINSHTFGNEGIQLDYNGGTPRMYVGDGSNEFLKYDGTSLSIQTQDAHISGSSITLKSPDFYLGDSSNYVSGSGGNLAIYSTGNTTLSGSSVTIETPTLFMGTTGSAFISASNSNLEISSSNFFLKSDGSINAGAGDFTIDTSGNVVMAGTITATAGTIGGFTIDSDEIKSGTNIGMSSATKAYTINDTTFGNTGIQLEYNSGTPRFFAGKSTGGYVKFDGTNVEVSSSKFLLGDIGTAFISGSDSNIEISSSAFHLTNTGNVTASNIILGDKAEGDYLQFVNGTLTVQGEVTANEIRTPALINGTTSTTANASSSISSDGLATFKSASIAGWDINSTEIKKGTDISLDSSNKRITINDSTFGNGGIQLDYNGGAPRFYVGNGSDRHLKYDGTDVDIQSRKFELDATDLEISSTNASMSLGEGNIVLDGANNKIKVGSTSTKQVEIVGSSTQGYIATGKTNASDTTTGFWLANNNTDPEFNVGDGTNFIKFDGGDLDISSEKLEISASTLQVSTTQASMSLGHDADYPRGRIILDGVGTGSFRVGKDADFINLVTGSGVFIDGDGNFKFGDSDGGITFNDGAFAITGSDIDVNVTDLNISATGFELSSQEASMSLGTGRELLLKGGNANPYVSIGQTTDAYGETGVFLGYVSSVSRPRVSYVGSAGHFKFDTGVDIDTTTFELDANAGDLQISSTQKSMSLNDQTIVLDGANAKITIGSANAVTIQGGASDNFMTMGSKTSFTHYDKSTVGIILGMDSAVPKFEMAKSGDDYLRWDSTDGLDLRTTKMEVSASNIQISSTQASMSIGDPTSTGGAIVLQSQGTDKMLKFGNKTTFDQTTTAGLIMGINGDTSNDPEFDYTVGTGNSQYIRMLTSGIDIKVPNFKLDTDRLDIDSANSRIDVYDDSGGVDGSDLRVRIGEVDPTTGNHYGMVIYDGTGSGSADELVHFSDVKNQIASWSLSNTQISSENLVLDSAGTIQTSDFTSGVKGWRITSANNGEAEFEKVTIRGTLSTTVFEKESVNAVGGQLYVANSTIYTSSVQLSATDTTMSVANVGGFTSGEILSAKKISDTGFKTEYMFVNSASRDNPSSEKDLSGKLYLVRGYSGSLPGTQSTASLGDAAQASQTYESGQVIVSTGKIGTGYVRINANPNDSTTPYIDIVERTGSAIYDISLKARLGDLSGLSSGLLYGETSPGFGLFTENVFLQGGITATTGSITGKLHIRTDSLNQLILGTDVQSTNDGIYLNDNNYWYTNDKFRIGDTNYYLKWDSSNITIVPQTFELNAGSGDIQISSTQKSMSLGNGDIHFHSPNSTTSYMRLGSNTSKAIYITGSSTAGVIRSGKTSVTSNTAGFWLANTDGDQEFVVGDATDYIRYSGSAVDVQTRAFELDANNGDLQLSSTQKSMSIANGAIELAYSASNQAYFKLGSTGGQGIEMTGSNYGGTIRSAKRNVSDTTAGFWLHNKAGTTEFHVGDSSEYIKFDGTDLSIASAHLDITASNIDMTTDEFHLDATDIEISSTEKSMSLGYNSSLAGGITLVGGSTSTIGFGTRGNYPMQLSSDGTDDYLRIGSQTFGGAQGGVILGSDNDVYKIELYKNASTYLKFSTDDSGLDVRANKIRLATPGMLLVGSEGSGGSNKLTLGGSSGSMSTTAGEGVYMDGSGNFRVGTATTVTSPSYMSFGSSALTVRTQDLVIDTSKIDITTEHGGMIALGASSASLADLSGTGIFLSGSGEFNLEYDSSNYIRLDGSSFDIRSENFDLLTSTQHISSSNGGVIAMGSTIPKDLNDSGIMLSGSGEFNFQVDQDNYIRQDGNAFDIKSEIFGLKTSTMIVSSSLNNGTIRLGSSQGPSSVTANTQGIYMDGTGDFQVYGDEDNYFRFDVSSQLDIKADTFGLRTSNLIISSSQNSGMISLGATPPSAYNSGKGLYLDGTGKFLAGKAAGERIQYDGSDTLIMSSSAFLLGDSGSAYVSGSNSQLEISSSNFFLKSDGTLNIGAGNITTSTSGDVTMTGTVTATAGAIGGWTLADGYLYGLTSGTPTSSPTDGLVLKSGANSVISTYEDAAKRTEMGYLSSGVYGFKAYAGDGNTIFEVSDTQQIMAGFYFSNTDMWAGNSAIGNAATKLVLGDITGTPKIALGSTADNLSMTVGTGFYADGDGKFKAGTANGYGIFWDASTLRVSSSEFYLGDATNYISGSGGAISVAADTFDLSTTNLRVSSSYGGTIAMGKTIPKSISGSGIFLSGSGDFLAGNHAGNKIQYAQGPGAIVMKSNTFSLDATTIVIDSSANDGKIALGASPPTAYNSGKGIYVDGTGKFLAGKAAGQRIQYDGSDTLVMSSSNFLMGTSGSAPYTGAYISGSNGNLSISSSNFFLSPAGDVTMTGTISSSEGNIAGWTVDSDEIKAPNGTVILDSDSSSGQVKLGPSGGPGSATGTSNAGAYLDGTGKFNFVGDANNYVRFNASGLEIQTPNFTASAAGDINIAGGISASSGDIGGWVIDNDKLRKTAGGGSVELRTGTGFIGLSIADSDDDIVTVGSSSTPFSVLNTAELSKWDDTGRNFTDAQASVGDELNHTEYDGSRFTYDTPWKLEIEFGQHTDTGTHNNISSNGGFITYVGNANNQWPPLGTPIGMDTGMTKQVKVVGSAGLGPTTATRAGGGVTHNGFGTNDIVIGGSTQYTSGSIVPGQAGNLSSISGPNPVQSQWNSNSSNGLPGHVTYKITDNLDNTFALEADDQVIDASMTYSTTPRQIADGIYISWNSAGSGTHTKGIWTVPIKCSGSLFYGANDGSPDTTGRTLLFPSGTLAVDPTVAAPKVLSYIAQTRATVDIGIGGGGHFVEFEYYIKRKENPHYNEAVNSGNTWGVFEPRQTPYDVTVNLIERSGASTYNILSTKNLAEIPTTWTKKTITGQINSNGLNSNDLLIEYTASVNTSGYPVKNSHYVDEIRIASQSVFTSKPIVEMNQDGLLVYSSPSQQFKVDGSGLTLKSDEVTFKNLNIDENVNITEKLTLTGSFENYATQSKFAGKTTFYNVNHATSSDHAFTEFIKTGSISFDSGSIDFKNRIRGGATGSAHQYIRQSYYGAYTHPEDTYLDDLTYGGGPSMIFGEEGVNTGFKLSSLQYTVPQRFGFGIRNNARVGTYSPDISEHREPKSIMHVRQATYSSGIVSPMVALELSGSNATIHDNQIHFRTIRSIYKGGNRTFTPDRRQDWQIGIDGETGVFKFTAADSGSYDATDIDYPSTLGAGILNISSNANSSGTGRVGIAVENPSYPLHVAGYDASNISIYAERDVAAYSDVRSKTEIETISGSLEVIKNIRGVTYRNIESGSAVGSRMMGVIAQELEPHLPEIVSTDGSGFKSVKYANLTALLIQAVKEQQEQIDELKREIEEMKDG